MGFPTKNGIIRGGHCYWEGAIPKPYVIQTSNNLSELDLFQTGSFLEDNWIMVVTSDSGGAKPTYKTPFGEEIFQFQPRGPTIKDRKLP